MNDLRNPLGKAFYELTQQVEALGGSPELTAVVVAIGALRDRAGAAVALAAPTAPAPTEPVRSKHFVFMLTEAYEAGVGKGRQAHERGTEIENPWGDEPCREAWGYGYEEGKKQAALATPPSAVEAAQPEAVVEPEYRRQLNRLLNDFAHACAFSDDNLARMVAANEIHELFNFAAAPTTEATSSSDAERLDAARYRHMRDTAIFANRNGPGLYWYLPRGDRGLTAGERLDKAIDAAIATKGDKL